MIKAMVAKMNILRADRGCTHEEEERFVVGDTAKGAPARNPNRLGPTSLKTNSRTVQAKKIANMKIPANKSPAM